MARLCQSLVIITAIFVLTFAPAFAATFNYSSSGSTAIPDGTGSNVCGTTVTRSINVIDSFTIGDLNVGLIISHTYKEDLLISLQSPNGTNVTIVNREGEGFDNLNIRLDDAETTNIQSVDHVITNPYPEFQRQPLSPLSAFNGENAIGTWTLSVQDCWNADTGALLDFYLEFTDTAGINPLIVTTTADTNTIGTLRYAINHANANASDDNITFNIPGLGPHVIDPTTALPTITDDGVSIDGSTQGSVVCDGTPNATGGMSNRKHYIVLFGNNHASNGLTVSGASNVTIKGLTIGNHSASGILATNADGLTLLCNHLGVSTDTTGDIGNDQNGARIFGSDNSIIGDGTLAGANVIGFNSGSGLYYPASNPSDGAIIKGNFLGVGSDGVSDIGNGTNGLYLASSTNAVIGGPGTERNIASGNTDYGIHLTGSTNIDVIGNYTGTTADGLTALPNRIGLYVTVGNNINVGNGSATNRNLISGNTNDGAIFISSDIGDIAGNYFGVNSGGNTVLANGWSALSIQNSTNIQVGGSTSGEENILSGSAAGSGLYIYGGSSAVTVEGNIIGLGANETTAISNTHAGIFIQDSDAFIGGETSDAGNRISNNAYSGVVITGSSNVPILSNQIYDNTQLGIDLNFDSYTLNDTDDTDNGPNDYLNFPVINEVGANGSTTVAYDITLDVPVNAPGYRIDFFKNTASDSTGYGEGEIYLGTINVTGDGNHTGSFTSSISVNTGDIISTTTTRKTASSFDMTSEFSETIASTSSTSPLVVTNTADTDTLGTLRYAINHANANSADDNITFNIAGTGPHKITLSSALPKITDDDVTIDGSTHPGASCGQLTNGTQHTLMVHIDGATAGADAYGMEILGANVSVKALSITNFDGYGLYAWSGGASNFVGDCLYIGVEPDGTTTGANVTVDNRSPGILFTNVSNLTLRNSLVSGHNDDAGDYGVRFDHVTGAIVQGNIIGLNANGNGALGNSGKGIQIDGSSSGIMIGGTTVATRNIISGNGGSAIRVRNTASNVTIIGNHIGVGVDGTTAFGNGSHGVFVQEGAVVTIGDGTTAGGNIIANNTSDGVSTGGSNTGTLAILSNQFYSNGGLGIDLGNDGLTANDGGDGDTGANELLNFPLLNEVKADGTTSIDYDVNLDAPSNANGYRVEFFKNTTADPSGYGEGEVYLGFVDIAHSGGDLNFTGSLTTTMTVNVGDIISATTTRKTGTLTYDITSEFSQNVTTVDANPASLTVAKTVAPLNAGDYDLPGNDVVYTFVVTNEGVGAVDADSIIIIDSLPPEIIFYNGDHDGPGPSTDVVGFEESSTSLTFNPSTDAFFSNGTNKPADLSECDYTPTAGYDPNVKYVCFNPKGTMQGGDPNPVFNIRFRATIQ